MRGSNITLITGACGGIGRACARELGRSHSLFLADIALSRVDALAEMLSEEGYEIAGTAAGDLSDADFTADLVRQARQSGTLSVVVHSAGLSPALATWDKILLANVVATEYLLRTLETDLDPGLVTVLIASMAGHLARIEAATDRLLEEPTGTDFLEQAKPLIDAMVMPGLPMEPAASAYNASKRAVMRACERRAGSWGKAGARIVSISPGTIWTPMGRKEVESSPAAGAVKDMTPLGWGKPMDIAHAVSFVCSDRARFITGCDIRVDGGVTPMLRSAMAG